MQSSVYHLKHHTDRVPWISCAHNFITTCPIISIFKQHTLIEPNKVIFTFVYHIYKSLGDLSFAYQTPHALLCAWFHDTSNHSHFHTVSFKWHKNHVLKREHDLHWLQILSGHRYCTHWAPLTICVAKLHFFPAIFVLKLDIFTDLNNVVVKFDENICIDLVVKAPTNMPI